MSQIFFRKHVVTIFFIVACLFMGFSPMVYGAVQTLTGDFSGKDSEGRWFVDIPFTINAHSEVDIEYDSVCNETARFYLRVAERENITDGEVTLYFIASSTSSIVENIPLYQGNYIVRLRCLDRLLSAPPIPEWGLEITSNPVSISFAQDQEPESEEPVILNSTRSFTGWLGFWGTAGEIHPTAPSDNGRDYYDRHIFYMKKDTKLKFKFEWGEFRTTTGDPDTDFMVHIYRYRDGNIYWVHDFPALENSGDITEEITLLEEGLYKVDYGGARLGFNIDRKRYGGYKATLILNGEEAPDVKIGGVHKISTRYWSDNLEQYLTREELVPGARSNVDILIANYGSQLVPVTLVYGLSVRNGPITPVGSAKLNIAPGGGSFAVYNTTLLTPANTPLALTGDLVVVLYGSANEVLDTFTTKVGLFSSKLVTIVPMVFRLLLEKDFSNPQVDD